MAEENKRSWGRFGVAAVCAALALVAVFGAYQIGLSGGRGGGIGKEAAKTAALSHAGVSEQDLSHYEITLDESDGASVYQVEFEAEGRAYDYAVSAADGSIIKFSRELDGGAAAVQMGQNSGTAVPEDSQIGETRAWEIAYDHAGIAAEEVSAPQWKLDTDDGVLVYELEFFSGGYEYDYEINAADGSVVKFEKEAAAAPRPAQAGPSVSSGAADGNSSGSAPSGTTAPASSGSSAPQSGASSGDIGEARAKEIALGHAGVAADSIANYKWELDFDDGISVYELEFTSGGYEYDYEINAANGSIVKFEKEATDTYTASQAGQSAADVVSEYIGEARAREIAYGHACLTAEAVTHCGVELDHHGSHHSGRHHGAGCCAYEIDFKSGGYEYEYKIDALTGEILEFQQERDD